MLKTLYIGRGTMTAIRLYGLVWLMALGLTTVLYFAGLINEVTLPIFGFGFSTLSVMGFVAVLPAWLNERHDRNIRRADEFKRNVFGFAVPKDSLNTERNEGHRGVPKMPELSFQ
jgi:hypothetical protein